MTIEECLRQIRVKAAMVSHLTDVESDAKNRPVMDADVLRGMAETCDEIGLLARTVHDSLSADALDGEVKRAR